jgi:hypothetical protein
MQYLDQELKVDGNIAASCKKAVVPAAHKKAKNLGKSPRPR